MTTKSIGIVAVLVTYDRPACVDDTLERLADQTLKVDHTFVVDNSPTSHSYVFHRGSLSLPFLVTHLRTGSNLGPAGGMQYGLKTACERAPGWTWALLLDDDDPPLTSNVVEKLVAAGDRLRTEDSSIGLVGLLGSRLSRATGLLRGSAGSGAAWDVDFIGGGYLPLLHRQVMAGDQSPFDERLFWGMEELDAGLRIRRGGMRVVALDDLAEAHGYHEKYKSVRAKQRASGSLARRYYSWRNLIAVCRADRRWLAAAATTARVLASGVGRSARSRDASILLVALRAVTDGHRGRLGRRYSLKAS